MELSAKYVRMIRDKQSFSAAARELFVSQPALSATVAKLEKELGFKIFDRSTSPISLTVRGSIYLDHLDELYERENVLLERLRAVNDMSMGSLTVGGRMYCAYYFLPTVCGEFYRRYPGISVTLDMDASTEGAGSETVDLMLSFSEDGSESTPLLRERLVVAIRGDHPIVSELSEYTLGYSDICSRNIAPEKLIEDVALLADVPFVKIGVGSDSDRRLDEMIPKHKVSPCIVVNEKTFEMRYRIMQQGLGAVLVSDVFVSSFARGDDGVRFFALADPRSLRTVYVRRMRRGTKNGIVDKFIATAVECCGKYDPPEK